MYIKSSLVDYIKSRANELGLPIGSSPIDKEKLLAPVKDYINSYKRYINDGYWQGAIYGLSDVSKEPYMHDINPEDFHFIYNNAIFDLFMDHGMKLTDIHDIPYWCLNSIDAKQFIIPENISIMYTGALCYCRHIHELVLKGPLALSNNYMQQLDNGDVTPDDIDVLRLDYDAVDVSESLEKIIDYWDIGKVYLKNTTYNKETYTEIENKFDVEVELY